MPRVSRAGAGIAEFSAIDIVGKTFQVVRSKLAAAGARP
jgi:hypothetical protein